MYADLIQENATVAGTGAITLNGNVTGWRKYSDAFGSGATVRYFIQNETRLQWEAGEGTFTVAGPDILTRDKVVRSSNGNNLVNFDDSAKVVICSADADTIRFGGSPAPVATGTKNARIVAYDPPLTALIDGHVYVWVNGSEANDAEATVDLGPGETEIVRPDGTSLFAKDMPADALILAKYVAADDALRLLSIPETAASVVFGGTISPGSLSTSQNDWNPTGWAGASIIRSTSSVAVDLTGLAGGRAGRVAIVQNIGSNIETLKNESSSSTAANRFALGGSDLALSGGASALLIYDGTASRWRLVAAGRGTGAASGSMATITAGENLADRDLIYLDYANTRGNGADRWYKVDTDATGPVKMSARLGIALAAISSGAGGLAMTGAGRVDGLTSLTAGGAVWASATAGGITQSAPAVPSTGTQIAMRRIGFAASATEIDFDPEDDTLYVARNSTLAAGSSITVEHYSDAGAPDRTAEAYLVQLSGATLIPQATGTAIGAASGVGGLAAAFDSNTSQSSGAAAQGIGTDSNIGKNYSGLGGFKIAKAEVFGASDVGIDGGGNGSVTLTLYGNSTNNFGSATSFGSVTFTDTSDATMRTITSTDQATTWNYVWVRAQVVSGAVYFGEVRFYEPAVARDEPVRIGSATIDAAATDCVAVRYDDGAGANAATKTTGVNRTNATRDLAFQVVL